MPRRTALALVAALAALPAAADTARVVDAEARRAADGLWRFEVAVAHADEGWTHYVFAWRIEDEAGEVLGLRELAHPHVDEQPFTRSLSGVALPEGTRRVLVRARDSVHGWGPAFPLELPR